MIRERGESSKKCVIVVLEGIKVSSEKTGIAPLWKATRDVINPEDEILVLTLLYVKPSRSSSDAGYYGDHQCNQSCGADPYVQFLRQEISQKKAAYMQIFRPFYDRCKSIGVKFQVKIAAGFRPKDIIIEEANNAKATWIVMDRCFARDLTFRLSGTDCSVSLVSHDEEAMVHDQLLVNDGSESSMDIEVTQNPQSPKLRKESILQGEPCVFPSLPPHLQSVLASTSRESEHPTMHKTPEEEENLEMMEPLNKGTVLHDNFCPKFSDVLRLPLQLSWEMIMEITSGFARRICSGHNNFLTYSGCLPDCASIVMVKRFAADSSGILEAEKQAAVSMHHKNILGLIGYHRSENATILVFPYTRKGSLHKYFCGREKQLKLTFQDKLKIAIGTAKAVRYMHEECPQGPIAHGDLQPSNIFLGPYLQPRISGFRQATWLSLEQASPISNNRCCLMNSPDQELLSLVKSDILSFGVLLLRLFCRKSVPQDDKSLIEWAKPLLLQRAFHELLDEESEILDMHGIYRVMAAATQCTRSNPMSRPCMSEVISILKGENFCAMQSSPSDSSQ